jgi:DNA-binding transcriptional MerR regulator
VPEERLSVSAAAKRAGIKTDTFRAYVSRGLAPQPDGVDETFGRKYWYAATIDRWDAERPGRGARTDLS